MKKRQINSNKKKTKIKTEIMKNFKMKTEMRKKIKIKGNKRNKNNKLKLEIKI